MPKTPNHEYNVPKAGVEDWHIPLNENFEQYDTDIEIRDEAANRGEYDPTAGAKFLETDTGLVYQGDGSAWVPTLAYGRYVPASDPDKAGNVLFGHPVNSVDPDGGGATIGGGGTANDPNSATENFSTVGGGRYNTVSSYDSTVGGGSSNTVSGPFSTVAGGYSNTASRHSATVGGGESNESSGPSSTVGGGYSNTASDQSATVGGGSSNTASGRASTVPGGSYNTASGTFAFAAGE